MLKCKNCIFKEKDRVHGHGEYWGICRILSLLSDNYDKYRDKDEVELNYIIEICSDSDDCKILKKFIKK